MYNLRKTFVLTETGIKSALLDPLITEVKDKKTLLLLRFNKKGNSWLLEYNHSGKTRRKKVATWPTVSAEKMRQQESDLLLKVVKKEPIVVSHFDTVGDLITWAMAREKTRSTKPETKKTAISIMNAQLLPRLGFLPVLELSKLDVDLQLVQPMKADDKKDSTIDAALSQLKKVYQQAYDIDLLQVNPVEKFRFEQFEKNKIKHKVGKLPTSKLSYVIKQLKAGESAVYLYVLFMLAYGTRKTETALMRWDWLDTDLAQPCIVFPADITKTAVELTLPLSDFILELLAEHQAQQQSNGYQGHYIFPSSRTQGPISKYMAHKWVLSISHKHWSAHDLRKLFTNSLLERGIDSKIVNKLLNHALSKIDKIYMSEDLPIRKTHAINLWHSELKKFIAHSGSDLIPTQINLQKWRKSA